MVGGFPHSPVSRLDLGLMADRTQIQDLVVTAVPPSPTDRSPSLYPRT